jgi:type I restriction enzyme S subunit
MIDQNNHTEKGLPKRWKWVRLSDITKINPKLPIEVKDENLEVSFLPMRLVEEERNVIHLTETRKYADVKKGFTPMANDDVIFAKITPCMENGKIAVVHSFKNGVAFGSTEFHVLRCHSELINKFLFYYLVRKKFRNEAEFNMTGAVGQRRVPKRFLDETSIPLPSIEVQQHIVFKIEELFSELDKGIEQLKTAQQQLKVYRQAVLKWAFEGRLTNENVKDNELPEGWKRISLREISDVRDGTHDTPKYVDKGIPFVTQKNIREFGLNFSDVKYISREDHEKFYKRSNVAFGDILISMIGANRGMSCIVNDKRIFSIKNVGLIKHSISISSSYLLYFLKSPFAWNYIKALSKGGAQEFVGLTELRKYPIIYCPSEPQEKVVQKIENRLSVADKLEETITKSLKQAEAIRQSILKKAFEGKLI